MSDYETILTMIEAVDPADTANLDEIDARVFIYTKEPSEEFSGYAMKYNMDGEQLFSLYNEIGRQSNYCTPQYTLSRDALKVIRPDGCLINIEPRFFCCGNNGECDEYGFYAIAVKPLGDTQ